MFRYFDLGNQYYFSRAINLLDAIFKLKFYLKSTI